MAERRALWVGVGIATVLGLAVPASHWLEQRPAAEPTPAASVGPFGLMVVPAGFQVSPSRESHKVVLTAVHQHGVRRSHILITAQDRGSSAPGPDDIGGPGRAEQTVDINGVPAVRLVQQTGPETLHRLAWFRDGYLISVVLNAPPGSETAAPLVESVARALRRA